LKGKRINFYSGECAMALNMSVSKVKFSRGISVKVAIGLITGLFIIIGIFSHLNVRLMEKGLMKMAIDGTAKNSISIKNAIDHAMITGDKQIIQTVVETVGMGSMLEDIKIVDIGGTVKWAKLSSERGILLDKTKIKSCLICHKIGKPSREPQTIVFKKDNGERVLRNVTPIDNKPECFSCHPAENKVIGKLLVDYSIKEADSMVSKNRGLLIASAVATLLSAVVMTMILFNRIVGRPIRGIFDKIQEVANGNLDVKVKVKGKDEMALLGAFFNNMVYGIKTYIEREQKEHIEERLTLASVADILNRSQSTSEAVSLILNTLNIGFGVLKCVILYISYDGKMEVKGAVGLTDEEAEMFKNYMEVAFSIDDYYALDDLVQKGGYFEVRRIKEMVLNGEIFIASGSKGIIDDFLVVPLKAANAVKGAIIVSAIKDSDISSDRAKKIFSIIASAIAPHFYIGACLDEKRQMKAGPFELFIEILREHIYRVRQYDGVLSIGIIKLKNYEGLCEACGAEKASEKVRDFGVSISRAIDKVHEAVRISEDRIAVILPMINKADAIEIIENACPNKRQESRVESQAHDAWTTDAPRITPEIRVVTYPDDGETPERLICEV
jgi:HAMP domain-containing protein/GGDEF domain-containing protein